MSNTDFRHLGRIKITGLLETLTGLHIGGTETGLSIGGADSPVIRNGLDGYPYIPGSSLKGKMRCMLERIYTPGDLVKVGNARVYKCDSLERYQNSAVHNLFGVTPEEIAKLSKNQGDETTAEALPTRLLFRDAMMSPESAEALERSLYTDMPLTQVKTEVVLDRITSAATPRQIERVPAGVDFHYEIIFNLYQEKDLEWLATLQEGMDLLEEDSLGGQGSRGYGKVRFATREVEVKGLGDHTDLAENEQVQRFIAELTRKKSEEVPA